MGAILDILSGKRFRRNSLQGIAFAEPMERHRSSILAGHPMLDNFAFALAFTVDASVATLVFNSKEKEFKSLAKSIDKEITSNLAAFLAWRHTFIFVEDDKADSAKSGESSSENSVAWWRDIKRVSEIMYPRSEAAEFAVTSFRKVESAIEAGEASTLQFSAALSRAILGLLNVADAGDPVTELSRSFGISAALVGTRSMLGQVLAQMPVPPQKS